MINSDFFKISPDVQEALAEGRPVVALESTVISHGLPRPTNLETARCVEAAIREEGAVPATIGIVEGTIIVGLNDAQLEHLADADDIRKVSRRDFGIVISQKGSGATTVAGTMIAAHHAGIQVFATGGIGGVHRGDSGDISADLPELAQTPVAVVCAGAKAILDLPRTLEWLETAGVPIIGYQTEMFPAFYATSSDLPVDVCVQTPKEVAAILQARWSLEPRGGVLITVPPPSDLALASADMEQVIEAALITAKEAGIRGKEVTPFLLTRVSELTEGRSLAVNLALLEQNARVAARIAGAIVSHE